MIKISALFTKVMGIILTASVFEVIKQHLSQPISYHFFIPLDEIVE